LSTHYVLIKYCYIFICKIIKLFILFVILANFTSPTDRNLLVARFNRIDISLVTEEGLQPIKEIALYGKIEIMKVFRPKV